MRLASGYLPLSILILLVPMGCDRDTEAEISALTPASTEEDRERPSTSEEEIEPVLPPVFCSGTTAHRWDITDDTDVDFFPDPLMEVQDDESPSGRRLNVRAETVPWVESLPDLLYDAVAALDGMSGFGTMGGLLIRFEGGTVTDLPDSAAESMTNTGWQLVDLGGPVPERVPFEARIHEEGNTVILWPLRPLRLKTQHALVVTTDAKGDDGDCIAPTATTKALLYGDEAPDHPNSEEATKQFRKALETLEIKADQISIMSVFTTHNEAPIWLSIAEEAEKEPVSWGEVVECTDEEKFQECTVLITVMDRRDEEGAVTPGVTPVEQEIPVTIWIPKDMEGPFPVVMYGHGLASHRTEGRNPARFMAEVGVATVAMDAISHGDHPSAESSDSQLAALGFLGIDLTSLSINPKLLRGNFDQTNLDRRRFIRLILSDTDFDGDGTADFAPEKFGYLGASLGAILGSQLLAISPEVEAAVLSVGGGRLMSIVTDTTEVAAYMGIIESLVGSKERFDRLVPLAQHVVDPADSALWGAHLLRDRFTDDPPPSVLLQVAMDDEVVPSHSGHILARSMGVTHLAPSVETIELLQVSEDSLQGNGETGNTHGVFQFDRVTRNGEVGPAYHVDTPSSIEGQYQMKHFVETWLDTGVPEMVNPYPFFNTPPRE